MMVELENKSKRCDRMKIKRKTNRNTSLTLKTISIVLSVALLGGAGAFIKETIDIEKDKDVYNELALEDSTNQFDNIADRYIEPEYDIKELKEKYPDLVGYITGACLAQPYPVVKDSILAGESYYDNHLPDGTSSSIGSICFNEENAFDLTDDFSVMYAHNIEGAMFGDLSNYSNQEYMNNKDNYFIYHSESGQYKLEPFSYYVDSEISYGDFNDEKKQTLIDTLKNNEIVNHDINVGVDDNIVTLYTCLEGTDPNYYLHPEWRVMVACKVTPLVLYNNYSNTK